MQRLFTTFADGWPGFGLLIQRLITGAGLLHGGIVLFWDTTNAVGIAPRATGAALAIFILIGLWTPIAGLLVAGVEIWNALAYPSGPATPILLATLGATLAMIGPGAFSLDARLFGRKHIGG